MHYEIPNTVRNILTINIMVTVRAVKLRVAEIKRNPVILYGWAYTIRNS